MNIEKQELLPIGSVVRLKDGKKKVMITGFCVTTAEDENKMYDYCGCMYPEGIVASDKNLVFNQNQIEELFFLGYVNVEEQHFKLRLYENLFKKAAETESTGNASVANITADNTTATTSEISIPSN